MSKKTLVEQMEPFRELAETVNAELAKVLIPILDWLLAALKKLRKKP